MAVTEDPESTKNSTEWSPIHPSRNQCPAPEICRTESPTCVESQYSQVPTGQSVNRSVPLPQVKGPPRKSPSTQSGQVQSNHQQPELWICLSVQYRSGPKTEQNSCCLNHFLE